MDREDGAGARRDRPRDGVLVQVEGVRPDIDEHRPRPEAHDGVGGGDEGEGRQDHLVAGAEVAEHGGHLQGGGAGRRQQHPADAETLLQQPAPLLREVAVAGDVAVGDRLGDVEQFLADDERLLERDGEWLHDRVGPRATAGPARGDAWIMALSGSASSNRPAWARGMLISSMRPVNRAV
jgi:hypothetical protein